MTTHHPAPNPRLIESASPRSPGEALELGGGNGGDAIWLADNQWTVTASDISRPATERLSQLAEETGLQDRIAARSWELNRGLPEREFDLINAHYLHAQASLDRTGVFRAAAGALRPGRHLLIVDHGSTAPWSWNQDPDQHFPTPRDVYTDIALDPSRRQAVKAETLRRLATGTGDHRTEVTDHILLIRRISR